LARASVVDFGGVKVRTAQAEDFLVYKTIGWRDRSGSRPELNKPRL